MSSAFASFIYKSCKTEYKYPYSEFFFFSPKAVSTICSQKKRVWKEQGEEKRESNEKVKLAISQTFKSRINLSSVPKGVTVMT